VLYFHTRCKQLQLHKGKTIFANREQDGFGRELTKKYVSWTSSMHHRQIKIKEEIFERKTRARKPDQSQEQQEEDGNIG